MKKHFFDDLWHKICLKKLYYLAFLKSRGSKAFPFILYGIYSLIKPAYHSQSTLDGVEFQTLLTFYLIA